MSGDGEHGARELLQPAGWARPRGYVNGVAASGRVIFIAGQIGWNPETATFESDDFVAQTARALSNIVAVLREAGAAPRHVTRMTWYITDRPAYLERQREIGAAYRAQFGKHFPAMSTIFVAALLEERAKVEIEATAVLEE